MTVHRSSWLAAAAVMPLLCACTAGGAAEGGPVTFGGDDGTMCFALPAGQSMLTQDIAVAPAGAPVTVRALELADGEGITLVEAFVTAESAGASTTGAARYVPGDARWRDRTSLSGAARYVPGDARWRDRTSLSGAVVPPGKSVNITAVLSRDGTAPARAAALTLTYTVGGMSYQHSNTTGYVLDDRCE